MTTRRNMIKAGAGLAAILASGKAPAAFIKSMLASRGSFLSRGGGAKLPYDAEVEWISNESGEGPYINLGHLPTPSTKVVLDVAILSGGNTFFGSTSTYGTRCSLALGTPSSDSLRFHTKLYNTANYLYPSANGWTLDGNRHSITVSNAPHPSVGAGTYAQFDDNQPAIVTSGTLSDFSDALPLHVFAYRRNLSSGTNDVLITTTVFRLYGIRIYEGSLAMDIIPVGCATEGCLYDRVSGQLFRNAGTGSFSYGNDK